MMIIGYKMKINAAQNTSYMNCRNLESLITASMTAAGKKEGSVSS